MMPKSFSMITRIWHGATPAAKSDEYLNLMRAVAIPDYRSTPGNAQFLDDAVVGAPSPNESPNLHPVFLCEWWNDTVHAQVLD
jgi:hypothetical protein